MKIEKNYYTLEQEQREEVERECRQESAARTEQENREYEESLCRNLKKLYARFEREKVHKKQVLNQQKLKDFQARSDKAVLWAQDMVADLTAETTDSLRGMIKFRADMFLITKETPFVCRTFFSELMVEADEVWFNAEGRTYTIVFWFELYDDVRI